MMVIFCQDITHKFPLILKHDGKLENTGKKKTITLLTTLY